MTESQKTKNEIEKTIIKRQYARRLLCFHTSISFDSRAYSGQDLHDPCGTILLASLSFPKDNNFKM